MPDVGHTLCWPGEAGDTWPGYRDACASTASTGGRLRTALRQEPWAMASLRLRGPYHFVRQSMAIPGGHGAGPWRCAEHPGAPLAPTRIGAPGHVPGRCG